MQGNVTAQDIPTLVANGINSEAGSTVVSASDVVIAAFVDVDTGTGKKRAAAADVIAKVYVVAPSGQSQVSHVVTWTTTQRDRDL